MIFLDRRCLRWTSRSFPSRFSGLCEVTDLECGDCLFFGHDPGLLCCVELKNPMDLVSSVTQTARLLEQLRKAHASLAPPDSGNKLLYVLVLQGEVGEGPDGAFCVRSRGNAYARGWKPVQIPGSSRSITYREVDNFLNSLSILDGVLVKKTRNEAETVRVVLDLYYWFQKPIESHTTTIQGRFYEPNYLGVEIPLVRRIAKELPGVGVSKARAAEKIFPTVEAMVQGKEKDWLAVEGIGKLLAERIGRALHGGKLPEDWRL